MEDKGTPFMQQTTWGIWTNWSVTCCFYAPICWYLCVVGTRSHIVGKSRTHGGNSWLLSGELILFVFLPQNSWDVLAELLNQTYHWGHYGSPSDHSTQVITQNAQISSLLVYKILYCNSLWKRRGLMKCLSNLISKLKTNIKNSHCSAPLYPRRGLKTLSP